jgi:hypothetical protein
VTAKLTTKNFAWFWTKICWKFVERSLIFSPPQDDQTHKPVKWCSLKDDNSNIWQLQDCICSVMCKAKQKHSDTKFQWERYKVVLHLATVFKNLSYQGTFLKYRAITLWKGNNLKKYKCCIFLCNILFYFISLKTFFGKMTFTRRQ